MTINSGAFTFSANVTESVTSGSKVSEFRDAITWSQQWSDGTGDNEIEKRWYGYYENQSGAVSLDLDNLTDDAGNALAFTKIKSIVVVNLQLVTDTEYVEVFGDTNGLVGFVKVDTDVVVVQPAGIYVGVYPSDGATVTAGTGDILLLTPSAAMDFEVHITGLTS